MVVCVTSLMLVAMLCQLSHCMYIQNQTHQFQHVEDPDGIPIMMLALESENPEETDETSGLQKNHEDRLNLANKGFRDFQRPIPIVNLPNLHHTDEDYGDFTQDEAYTIYDDFGSDIETHRDNFLRDMVMELLQGALQGGGSSGATWENVMEHMADRLQGMRGGVVDMADQMVDTVFDRLTERLNRHRPTKSPLWNLTLKKKRSALRAIRELATMLGLLCAHDAPVDADSLVLCTEPPVQTPYGGHEGYDPAVVDADFIIEQLGEPLYVDPFHERKP